MTRPCTYRRFSLIGKDELAKDALEASIKGNGIPTLIFAVFHIFTPALTQARTPVPGLPGMYTNVE